MRTIRLTTPPATEPLTAADLQEWTGDKGATLPLLNTLLKRWRSRLEEELRLSLITQTWEMILDAEDAESVIQIPRPPLQSITSVSTVAGSTGAETVVSSSSYRIAEAQPPHMARLILLDGQVWGGDIAESAGMKIVFVSGYGDDGTDIYHHSLMTALSELVEFSRRHRGSGILPQGKGGVVKTPEEVVAILDRVRRFEVVRGE